MNIALVVVGGVPAAGATGSLLTLWTAVRHLLAHGHAVAVVVVHEEAATDPGATLERRAQALRDLGADVVFVESRAAEALAGSPSLRARLGRLWRPSEAELFPNLLDADRVGTAVEALAPDCVYAFHWEAVAATRRLAGRLPRLAVVVDLPHVGLWYRWRQTPKRLRSLSQLAFVQARLRHQPRLLVTLLNECEGAANFAAHHADWLRRSGARHCEYLPIPIEDVGGGERPPRRPLDGRPPRLLLIGHFRGISTLSGLRLLADEVLPPLERELGRTGLEARLVGGYELPPELRSALDRPAVRVVGWVEDAGAEFAQADLLLVPTTIPLGTRVRIVSGFSFGCPVVAHSSNALGLPQLRDGDNALLADSGSRLADRVLELLADDELRRRLAEGGRATYERWFRPEVAVARLEEMLRRVALEARPRASEDTRQARLRGCL